MQKATNEKRAGLDDSAAKQAHDTDHADTTRFPTMNTNNWTIAGILVFFALIGGILILGYNVMYSEPRRMDAAPANDIAPPPSAPAPRTSQ